MSEDPWSGIEPSPQLLVGLRIERAHPLDVYWVRAGDGSPGLLLRGVDPTRVPDRLPKPRGLMLETGDGAEGFEARMFLREPDDRDVFRTLCNDVIAYSSSEGSRSAATASVFRRLAHWHSLMSRARTTAMAPHEIRGLIGELCFLERLIERRGFDTALQSWVAPDDHPQDFAFNTRIVEIKTRVSGARQHVHISSLEQLESAHLPLSLMVIELVHSDAADATSLNEICERIELLARGLGIVQEDALLAALLRRGYIRQDAYDADTYCVVGTRAFDVRDGFPRLMRADVDMRIPQASYTLDLAYLRDFEIATEPVLG
jgi:hypothetical protein